DSNPSPVTYVRTLNPGGSVISADAGTGGVSTATSRTTAARRMKLPIRAVGVVVDELDHPPRGVLHEGAVGLGGLQPERGAHGGETGGGEPLELRPDVVHVNGEMQEPLPLRALDQLDLHRRVGMSEHRD